MKDFRLHHAGLEKLNSYEGKQNTSNWSKCWNTPAYWQRFTISKDIESISMRKTKNLVCIMLKIKICVYEKILFYIYNAVKAHLAIHGLRLWPISCEYPISWFKACRFLRTCCEKIIFFSKHFHLFHSGRIAHTNCYKTHKNDRPYTSLGFCPNYYPETAMA